MSDPAIHPLDRLFLSGDPLHVAIDGQMQIAGERCRNANVLLPGSFCPVHRGHWELACAAQDAFGQSVAFELSVVNVDKPTLTREEIRRRLEFFEGQAAVWLTRAPTFVEKAELFRGAVFVVGADTALRIVLARYYDDGEPTMHAALQRIRSLGCRFLVAGRVDALGQYWRCGDLPIPPEFRDLFEEIAPKRFRVDLSSSELRRIEAPRTK